MQRNENNESIVFKPWWFITFQSLFFLFLPLLPWALLMEIGGERFWIAISLLTIIGSVLVVHRICKTSISIVGDELRIRDAFHSRCLVAREIQSIDVEKPGAFEPLLFVEERSFTALRITTKSGNSHWAWGSALHFRKRETYYSRCCAVGVQSRM